MSPKSTSGTTTETDETKEAEVAQAQVEEQVAAEPREITVSIDVKVRTTDPDVTDEAILAAAEEQVTLPNNLWVNKPGGGQISIAIISAQEAEEEAPVP